MKLAEIEGQIWAEAAARNTSEVFRDTKGNTFIKNHSSSGGILYTPTERVGYCEGIDPGSDDFMTEIDPISEMFKDIEQFLAGFIPGISFWTEETDDDGEDRKYIGFTIGYTQDDDGEISWDYQTGDNCFSGGAYGHPRWLVTEINDGDTPSEVISSLKEQFEAIAY